MMNKYYLATKIVFNAIDEVNQHLLKHQRIEKSLDVVLIGSKAAIDSMSLLNIIIIAEQHLNELGIDIKLLDEDLLIREDNPFQSVKTFIEYVALILTANHND